MSSSRHNDTGEHVQIVAVTMEGKIAGRVQAGRPQCASFRLRVGIVFPSRNALTSHYIPSVGFLVGSVAFVL